MRTIAIGTISALLLAAAARGESADDLVKEFTSTTRSRERGAEELREAYGKILDKLVPAMGAEDFGKGGGERGTLQRVCWVASRPGADAEREAVCAEVAKRIGAGTSRIARLWLIRQLSQIGRAEVVDGLAAQLDDADATVRDAARRALENSPADDATRALSRALRDARDDAWRAALLTSLGNRGDESVASAVRSYARDRDDEVRTAALYALAAIGDGRGARYIEQGMETGSPSARSRARDAYLTLADNLAESNRATALTMYRRFIDAKGHIKCAAVVGLGRAGGIDEFDTIMGLMEDDDAEVRGAAGIALEMMPVDSLRAAIERKLAGATAKQKVGLLRILAQHGDTTTQDVFMRLARDDDGAVRLEAIAALERHGDARCVRVLVGALSVEAGEERTAARKALDHLGGDGVDRTVFDAIAGAADDVRVELLQCLAARNATSVAADVLPLARDLQPKVRREAFRALAKLASQEHLAQLVRLVVSAPTSRDAREAVKAVTATCKRIEDREARARPVIDAMFMADAKAKQSLLSILGSIGGDAALTTVRGYLGEADVAIKDAALRALTEWPDDAAAEDLLRLARYGDSLKHKILSLRGYVRVVGLPSDRKPVETLLMYQDGMRAAGRVEEKRLVLAGMGEVHHVKCLEALRAHARETSLADEASAALIKVAVGVKSKNKEEAKDALRAVEGYTTNETIRKNAADALALIEKYEDFIADWQLAGPYSQKGKKCNELFGMAFAPEEDGDVNWRIIKADAEGGGDPWLAKIERFIRGNDRVAYLRAEIFAPRSMRARLEIGSDDGVKVWLNDSIVHENNVNRGTEPGADKVDVSLKQGWNQLMMKVTNGSGNWSACARVRSPEGEHVEGVKFRIDRSIFGGHITEWQVSGPYEQKGKSGPDLFDVPFAPETGGDAKWRPIKAGTHSGMPWLVQLDRALKGDNRVAYLRVEVNSPADRIAQLHIGSDDGVKVWLNGQVVHKNNATRAVGVAQDKPKVRLRRGWNMIMMKITQGGGEWSACLRVRNGKGGPMKDLETRLPRE